MPTRRPSRTIIGSGNPELVIVVTDDGSRTLRHVADGKTWHSESGALSESRLVFLENSRIVERLRAGQAVRVFEIGFGTGLNFWITASAATRHSGSLEYVSVEPFMLPPATIDDLNHHELSECSPAFQLFAKTAFRRQRQPPESTIVQRQNVTLRIMHRKLADLPPESLTGFDAVYHDPFDPAVSPDLWTSECFERLYRQLQPAGRLVTYCVKSEIQRRLQSVGFLVSKTRGPAGGKREVLIAEKPMRSGGGGPPGNGP